MKRLKKTDSLVKGMMMVSVIFFLTGCDFPKDLGVYDKSVPPEQRCTLIIDKTLYISKFDDKRVSWAALSRTKTIQIPEGNHSFVVHYAEYDQSAQNILVSKFFRAGETYEMRAFVNFNLGSVSVNILGKEERLRNFVE